MACFSIVAPMRKNFDGYLQKAVGSKLGLFSKPSGELNISIILVLIEVYVHFMSSEIGFVLHKMIVACGQTGQDRRFGWGFGASAWSGAMNRMANGAIVCCDFGHSVYTSVLGA